MAHEILLLKRSASRGGGDRGVLELRNIYTEGGPHVQSLSNITLFKSGLSGRTPVRDAQLEAAGIERRGVLGSPSASRGS